MRRINTLIRPLLAALAVAAILVPSAFASRANVYVPPTDSNTTAPTYWSYDYQAPIPRPRAVPAAKTGDTDTPWAAIAVSLAGVTLLLGAATVLPRRRRQRVAV
jgi:LPXTG-motif cell wall-anchored protein